MNAAVKEKIPDQIYVGERSFKQKLVDKVPFVVEKFFLISACLVIAAVFIITLYMIISGAPAIVEIGVFDFLLGKVWAPTASDPQFGILPMILSSLIATLGAVVIGVPIGILTSIFICEFAPKKLSGLLNRAVELLAGIPSVIYGLIGMLVIAPTVASIFGLPIGTNLFTVILVLCVMVLPTIVNITQSSLKAVDPSLKEASEALGAMHIQTIFKVMIPAARSGIMAGVVLGIGRAVGETMAVMMVAGNVANMPEIFKSVKLLTTGIVHEMSYASDFHRSALFGIGLVLFVFIMIINLVLNLILKKAGQKYD